jgi:hypothetical protein
LKYKTNTGDIQKMYTLKSIVRRGTPMAAIVAIVAATVLPSAAVFADALNPLTERSLLLSSSAPGFADTDGSGNSEGNLNANGEEYAPPGSGPNGKKSGETFSFNVSTDSSSSNAIKAFTLQYCTKAAGYCQAPGDNTGDADPNDDGDTSDSTRGADTSSTSDLNVNYTSPVVGTDFDIYVNGVLSNTGWSMATSNKEDPAFVGALTGKNNYITLTNSGTGAQPSSGQQIKIVFKASSGNYITNPGSGAFFVKMNTYSDTGATTILDGGVTVANVMTDSIHITTKVLETMAFSVGTQNPDTQAVPHGSCDAMQVINGNRLNLGNVNAENSLETTQAYDTHSYWRLSSNSSGGATVYYSGDTLRNTVGDHIAPIGADVSHVNGAKDYSHPGTEQFGLALVNPGADTMDGGSFPANHITPTTAPLVINADYADGDTASISDTTTTNNAQFAFDMGSQTVPAEIAQENTQVLSCATGKVRYVGNIAADTPAGVYTTKINYLAAPQY